MLSNPQVPLFRTVQWTWFVVAMFWTYGQSLTEFFRPMGAEVRYLTWTSFGLYWITFIITTLSLKKVCVCLLCQDQFLVGSHCMCAFITADNRACMPMHPASKCQPAAWATFSLTTKWRREDGTSLETLLRDMISTPRTCPQPIHASLKWLS